jgi:acetyl-CoA decarbonylase/synthase complex subunit beta
VGKSFPKLRERVFVEVIGDGAKLQRLAPEVRAQKQARRVEIETATDDDVEEFVGCTGCSPFAPDHVCIITPERPPQCGQPSGHMRTGARYGYDDMSNIHHSRLQRDVNSYTIIPKGQCLDAVRGEWSGANAHAAKMTQGRTHRVFLHALAGFPHTGCGCFRVIMFVTDLPRPGVAVMDRAFAGRCPDGRSWKDLHYELAGKQCPGMAGAGLEYLRSKKFLRGEGGWKAVVWVSPKVAQWMGGKLPERVEVGRE